MIQIQIAKDQSTRAETLLMLVPLTHVLINGRAAIYVMLLCLFCWSTVSQVLLSIRKAKTALESSTHTAEGRHLRNAPALHNAYILCENTMVISLARAGEKYNFVADSPAPCA